MDGWMDGWMDRYARYIKANIITHVTAHCTDHLINGVDCTQIPNICDDAFGKEICAKTCQQCCK
jgi:hypothetical protein